MIVLGCSYGWGAFFHHYEYCQWRKLAADQRKGKDFGYDNNTLPQPCNYQNQEIKPKYINRVEYIVKINIGVRESSFGGMESVGS